MRIAICCFVSLASLPLAAPSIGELWHAAVYDWGDDFGRGVRAYESARYRESLAAFREAASSAGDYASAELHYNLALAAFGAGDLSLAESACTRAAEHDDDEIASLAEFLRGNVAFQRCTTAALQAARPESPPFAYDVAIRFGEAARDAWRVCVLRRDDWPEARRNLERVERFLAALRKQKEAADQRDKQKKQPKEQQPPEDPPPSDEEGEKQEAPRAVPRLVAQLVELSPEDVKGLLEKLDDKETEKRKLRRDRRREPGVRVERDW